MNWNSTLYDQRHAFIFKYGEAVLDLLDPKPGERILDVGCGTGHLTNQIAQAGAHVVGIDRSPTMIDAAHEAYPEIAFVVADATEFAFDRRFDAIFSNAALHWVMDAERAVERMAAALRVGGRFVVEFGGKGNIAGILSAVEAAIREETGVAVTHERYFPGIAEYAGRLERHGLLVTSAWLIDRPTKLENGATGLRDWIEMFEQDVFAVVPPGRVPAVLDHVENLLAPTHFRDGAWYADYKRLRIVAGKID